jgi:hypothetical protein
MYDKEPEPLKQMFAQSNSTNHVVAKTIEAAQSISQTR